MMGAPIRPEDIGEAKTKYMPPAVFDVFNELIASRYVDGEAAVKQEDVVALLLSRLGCKRDDIFKNHYLDVEEAYRAAGWHVEYDKPAYNENYPATFTFTRRLA